MSPSAGLPSQHEDSKAGNRDGRVRDQALRRAILSTIAYSDIFDYPLTREEVHRYLIGVAATFSEVEGSIADAIGRSIVSAKGDYVMLPGRENLVAIRQERTIIAKRLWRAAIAYTRIISRIPFVRMIAITGTLAVNNPSETSDIDLFLVTCAGRLWLTRIAVIAIVKIAALRRVALCPNYLVSERALVFLDRNLFTAHEVAQMIPLHGQRTYQEVLKRNSWIIDFLPNVSPYTRYPAEEDSRVSPAKRLAESALQLAPFDWLEDREMRNKIGKLRQSSSSQQISQTETEFGRDHCKGHFQGHGEATLESYEKRVQKIRFQ